MKHHGKVRSRTLVGIDAIAVTVEATFLSGLPKFNIVGLPEAAVRESRDRIRGAMTYSDIEFPQRAIVVNLAPADLPKQGGCFDLPIALAILQAMDLLTLQQCEPFEFVGELSLAGELRPVSGALPIAMAVASTPAKLVLPVQSAAEAALCESCPVYAARSLSELIAALAGTARLHRVMPATTRHQPFDSPDMCDVKGQLPARRALEIACAGNHNLLMVGPPGTGKSMLASRTPGLLPPMQLQQAIESATVQSISSTGFSMERWRQRPFRAPHHTASGVALVGGGSNPRPGEISLAHHGVLFLDELTEFPRTVLDVLREPLEAGQVTIARAGRSTCFPACFQLIAAMNPCPCGYSDDPEIPCRCTDDQKRRYQGRLSGPFLDRIDMQVGVPRIDPVTLSKQRGGETSDSIRMRVNQAHQIQHTRQQCDNSALGGSQIEDFCVLQASDQKLLEEASRKLKLSVRAHFRILKVARTIADLDQLESIETGHLLEAISYRQLGN